MSFKNHFFIIFEKQRRIRGHNEDDDDDEDLKVTHHSRMEDFLSGTCKAAEQAEEFVKKVWAAGWRVVHHHYLPDWLQDNDFLHTGHRPPTNSFLVCFKSIFRIHTETGNIWSHLLGRTSLPFDFKSLPEFEFSRIKGCVKCVFHFPIYNYSLGL